MPPEINYDVQLLAVVTAFKEYTRSVAGFQGALAVLRAPRSAGRLERLQSLWKMQEFGRR
jgi:hypothetical protein